MKVHVELTRDPILARGVISGDARNGAVVEFAGVVRGVEDGRSITGLDYEAYEPMAVSEMERIAGELREAHPCHALEIVHRIGHVPVGEVSIWVRIEAKHRSEAFGMLAEFMDRLKRDVPIWKRVVA